MDVTPHFRVAVEAVALRYVAAPNHFLVAAVSPRLSIGGTRKVDFLLPPNQSLVPTQAPAALHASKPREAFHS